MKNVSIWLKILVSIAIFWTAFQLTQMGILPNLGQLTSPPEGNVTSIAQPRAFKATACPGVAGGCPTETLAMPVGTRIRVLQLFASGDQGVEIVSVPPCPTGQHCVTTRMTGLMYAP